MSDKRECPSCKCYTSEIERAYRNDDPCPYCGLAAATIQDIEVRRRSFADAALLDSYEALAIRAGKAEAEVARLGRIVERVTAALICPDDDA